MIKVSRAFVNTKLFAFSCYHNCCVCMYFHFRVRLSKRRGKTAKSAMNSKLVVRHREMTEDEVYAQVITICTLIDAHHDMWASCIKYGTVICTPFQTGCL